MVAPDFSAVKEKSTETQKIHTAPRKSPHDGTSRFGEAD